MRSRSLHAALSAFVGEAASCLADDRAHGAELPFDVVETGRPVRGGTPLYCYRPMTGEFILARLDRLQALETYLPALRGLASIEGLGRYLRSQGRRGIPSDRRSCAEHALFVLLSEVFEDATEFEVSRERLERVYGRLESALFADVTHTTLVGMLRGVEMESSELLLGAGLALVQPEAIDDGPPDELLAGAGDEPAVLATLSVEAAPGDPGTVEEGRHVLRGLVEALQLFGDACVTVDPLGWVRVDDGSWHHTVVGREAPTRGVLRIGDLEEDELRAFCSLVSRRAPRGGELAWALARFRMGCERDSRWETLTDHLLALRALLGPEGDRASRLPGRLAALCALPEERSALAQRMADVLAVERTLIEGLEPRDRHAERLADELTRHLRALLRDVICGHLDPDLSALADGLIAQDAAQESLEDPAQESLEDVAEVEQPVDQAPLEQASFELERADEEMSSEDLTVDEAGAELAGYDEPEGPSQYDAQEQFEHVEMEADPAWEEGPDDPTLDEAPDDPTLDEAPEDPVEDAPEDPVEDEPEDPAAEPAAAEAKPRPARPARKRARPRATASRSRSRS